jgi:hypothetical protein
MTRDGTESALEPGHHKTARSGEMDVLPPLRDSNVFSRYVVGWMVADARAPCWLLN